MCFWSLLPSGLRSGYSCKRLMRTSGGLEEQIRRMVASVLFMLEGTWNKKRRKWERKCDMRQLNPTLN